MAKANQERPGCFRRGCCGCLIFLAVAAAILGIWLVLGLTVGNPEPAIVRAESTVAEATRAVAHGGVGAAMGRIELDISLVEFLIVPGEPGTPLRIEGSYDRNRYRLVERFEGDLDSGWRYRVKFGRKSILNILHESTAENRLVLVIPRDLPIDLDAELGVGESRLDLGGLDLRAARFKLGIGEHRVVFGEPTKFPLERFQLDAGIGEHAVGGLGNASPAVAEIESGIGEFTLDLDGPWRTDADIRLACGIGQCSYRPPGPGTRFELVGATARIGDASNAGGSLVAPDDPELTAGAPVVRLRARILVGELLVAR